MHPIGVHSHLFRGSPAAVAEACRRYGLTCVQLTPNFPGLTFHEPGQFTPGRCREAAEPFRAAGLRVACLSATANLMDPDLNRRHQGIMRLHALLRHCRDFDSPFVVTETGTLSPRSPWAPYPPNRLREAWAELRCILGEALRVAEEHGATLLLKAHDVHLLATAEDVERLREELPSAQLGFVMDPAGFLLGSEVDELDAELEQFGARLGPWTPVVHAKDLAFEGQRATTPRVGRGMLDYQRFFRIFGRHQPNAPVILEHVRPEEVVAARAYLEQQMEAV